MYVDNIKLSAKMEKELETLLQTIRIYGQYFGVKFGIEKRAMLIRISGKRRLTEAIKLPNQKEFSILWEKETH